MSAGALQKIYFSSPGVFCSAGKNIGELWTSVCAGDNSGIKKIKTLSGKEFFAARVEDHSLPSVDARLNMKIIRMEAAALLQIEDFIFEAKEKYGSERIAVCVGSCDNGSELSIAGHKTFFEQGTFPPAYTLENQCADYVATFVSEHYGLKGASLAFTTACASSAAAISKAAELIRSGLADAVVAGGVDIASDTVLLGFDSLESVSLQKTNPFSKNRSGITLGDGAAFFLLSRDNLLKNGLPVILSGSGQSSDAYHITSPNPDGSGAADAMQKALDNASLRAEDIDYINLHGTGTRLNDSMEAKAVEKVFGSHRPLCSSTKSETGHTLGAAGALEAAVCWALIQESAKGSDKVPIQAWDGERDPELPELNFACSGACLKKRVKNCMSNSFAFGGSNSVLILSAEDSYAV
ncbi:MAG: 3-oxoacyl-ACP synthase [Treponema sp.]|nr:3-oxoacyl-ACP synthase [Treponema sp.]